MWKTLQVLMTVSLGLLSMSNSVQGKITCFDQQKDVEGNWVGSSNLKYVDSAKNLPSSFGRLNLDGTGLWYIEGAGKGVEVKISNEKKLYTNRAKTVQIYMRYYDKSPRRASLYPLKPPLPLVTLPATTGSDWTEVRYDVDASGPSIEISSYLSSGQFLLFEKIVLAVDSVLPQNPASACVDTVIPATGASGGRSMGGSTASSAGSVVVPTLNTPNTTTTITENTGTCSPSAPPAECKCNCLCNCNKC